MKKISCLIFSISIFSIALSSAQTKKPSTTQAKAFPAEVARPKLVVGLVVDQMRWDYLYRYYNRYTNGGFKRLINEGFSVENTFIPYTPTYTACGHTCIYTGSVPAVHGIIGNDWYDPETKKNVYCTEDSSVSTVGSTPSSEGNMSPKNMLTTTITDELRLATNFRGKVIGISLKDRGSILPAGHAANAAYWYQGSTGNWITSTYYMKEVPTWIADYNKLKLANKFYAKNWETLYPMNTYVNSTADEKAYEGKASTFPHQLTQNIDKNFDAIRSTPYGNTITLDLAKLAILSEDLGQDNITDFLAVSCSSTDYVGHAYGPNSVEAEDTYLRLDKDFEEFFNYLDKKVGKGNYTVFLTADHGAAHVPGFMQENKLPSGVVSDRDIANKLNAYLNDKFKVNNVVLKSQNNQIIFDHDKTDKGDVSFDVIKSASVEFLKRLDGFQNAVDIAKISQSTLQEIQKKMIINGYNARRSGDIYYVLQPNWFNGGSTGTTHGNWNPYDSHIPLVFMGWGIKPGASNKTHYMTDIAPTLAALLHIQMPNGNVGEPITEITSK
ncbi:MULTISPECIES: alkaline phosphatase PafA [unclassified Pedobacter]|uniref:alkaline phosphatase PafA n=1 Tax=unclassified Pedobacter TaxID=2628915 RepID=UPI00142100F1|nr:MULTISPECIES: alkaline phosphatase PafA [unclassified Pedobacter]NII84018.1 putative AlkP superfamily pyrophosphatase or phosphodiesterase [Pedobacter sp. SG908]NMN37892.1 putative AlkP superfamily pyrophosphatase or phosphodiesterase [Pedobacter sp. SG918]